MNQLITKNVPGNLSSNPCFKKEDIISRRTKDDGFLSVLRLETFGLSELHFFGQGHYTEYIKEIWNARIVLYILHFKIHGEK